MYEGLRACMRVCVHVLGSACMYEGLRASMRVWVHV